MLLNMVGTLEHVLQDLLVDRDILSESLNLYMSLVSHRTNEVMKCLIVVSVIFLPLTGEQRSQPGLKILHLKLAHRRLV